MPRGPVDRELLLTTIVFAGISVLAAAMPAHNDTWWHLRTGMETLNGRSPFVDHFSWTVAGRTFWNTSWLAQVVFAVLHAAGAGGAAGTDARRVVATDRATTAAVRGGRSERFATAASRSGRACERVAAVRIRRPRTASDGHPRGIRRLESVAIGRDVDAAAERLELVQIGGGRRDRATTAAEVLAR